MILSTHIVSDVSYIADTILMMKQGKILLQGSMEEVTDSIRGKVWEVLVDDREADRYSRNLRVVNLHHEGNQVRLRMVEDTAPAPDARAVEPSLEDLFLYHFGEEVQGERREKDENFDFVRQIWEDQADHGENSGCAFFSEYWRSHSMCSLPSVCLLQHLELMAGIFPCRSTEPRFRIPLLSWKEP